MPRAAKPFIHGGRPTAAARLADDVQGLGEPTVPLSNKRFGLEPVERYVSRKGNMQLGEFSRCADID